MISISLKINLEREFTIFPWVNKKYIPDPNQTGWVISLIDSVPDSKILFYKWNTEDNYIHHIISHWIGSTFETYRSRYSKLSSILSSYHKHHVVVLLYSLYHTRYFHPSSLYIVFSTLYRIIIECQYWSCNVTRFISIYLKTFIKPNYCSTVSCYYLCCVHAIVS